MSDQLIKTNTYLITVDYELPGVPGPTPAGYVWSLTKTFCLRHTSVFFPSPHIVAKAANIAYGDKYGKPKLRSISWVPSEYADTHTTVEMGVETTEPSLETTPAVK